MRASYTKNYIQIYFWKGISLVLNFLSMFIVIPYLTSKPTIYGIYSICISVSIFLAYADLGFLGAGQKYAAEYYARGESKEEVGVIGFTIFILSIFLLFFSLAFLYLSFNPSLLIKGLVAKNEFSTASLLFMIIALFTPVTLLQRLLQMIYGIRLEDYIIQRTNIIGNTFKILSVFYFFRQGTYNIVGYFLFVQIISLLTAFFTLIIAKRRFNYNFKGLFVSICFNTSIFRKTKTLAFTSLFITIAWILYFELDPTIIGKFFGAKQVAIYAIGLTMLSFFRSIFAILYSPFNNRFNHFIGINDINGLRSFYRDVIINLAPIVVFPVLTVALLAKPLILCWVGIDYFNSIFIAKFLIFTNLFIFITIPTSLILLATERIKEMYFVNILIVVVFWSGILLTNSFWGLKSFAIFKFVAFAITGIFYYRTMINFLRIGLIYSIRKIILPLVIPSFFLIIVHFFTRSFLPLEKSKINLLIVAGTAICLMTASFILHFLMSVEFRRSFNKIFTLSNLK